MLSMQNCQLTKRLVCKMTGYRLNQFNVLLLCTRIWVNMTLNFLMNDFLILLCSKAKWTCPEHRIRIHRRATRVGAFEVFEAAHVALRTLLAFSQPVNCIFWPIGMLNWLVAASKLHKHRVTCCTAEWPFYSFFILWPRVLARSRKIHVYIGKFCLNVFHNFVSQSRGTPPTVLLYSCVFGMPFPTFNKYNSIPQWHRNRGGTHPPNNENVGAGLYNIYRPLASWCWVVPPPPIVTFFLRHCTMQHWQNI